MEFSNNSPIEIIVDKLSPMSHIFVVKKKKRWKRNEKPVKITEKSKINKANLCHSYVSKFKISNFYTAFVNVIKIVIN